MFDVPNQALALMVLYVRGLQMLVLVVGCQGVLVCGNKMEIAQEMDVMFSLGEKRVAFRVLPAVKLAPVVTGATVVPIFSRLNLDYGLYAVELQTGINVSILRRTRFCALAGHHPSLPLIHLMLILPLFLA